MAETEESSAPAVWVKLAVSIAAMIVGLFLVFGSATPLVADAVFVAGIAVVLAVYLWPGVTDNQARTISIVLVLLAGYAVIRGFGLLDLTVLRELGGIAAIVSGVILALPFVRSRFAKS